MSLKRFAATFLGMCFVLVGSCVAATGVHAATGDVLIRVMKEDRQPFAGATVEIHCTDWGTISSATDESGSIVIDPTTVSGQGVRVGEISLFGFHQARL